MGYAFGRAGIRTWRLTRGTLPRATATLTKLLVHVTFSTKDRAAFVRVDLEPDLYAYVGGICRRMQSPLLAMGGTADHVHLMVSLGKTVALSDLLMEIKRDSSKWIRERREFEWQDGYFGFPIGESAAEAPRAYIGAQKEHHARIDYKDEVRSLLRKYGIEWDEWYIWE